MAKKRKGSDAVERKLDALTAAVLAMMSKRGQGAEQTYGDFNQQDIFEYPSPQMFSKNLAGDTVMEGPIQDYAAEVVGGKNPMSRAVAGRTGDAYMQDVYRLLMQMGSGKGSRSKGVR